MQTVEKQVVLEENWQVLAVVFPPFAQLLGKLRITGLLAQFDISSEFSSEFPRPLLLQPTILTSERFGTQTSPWDPESARRQYVPASPDYNRSRPRTWFTRIIGLAYASARPEIRKLIDK